MSPINRTRSFKWLFIGVWWRFQSRWLPWLVSGVLQTLCPALHESLSLPFFHTLRISLWSRSFPYTTYTFLSPQKKLNKNQKCLATFLKVYTNYLGQTSVFLRFLSLGLLNFVHVHFFFEKSLLFMLIKKVGNRGKISRCIVRAHQPSLVSTFCCVDWLIFYLQHHSPVWNIYYCRWIIVCGACFISLSFFAALTYIYD